MTPRDHKMICKNMFDFYFQTVNKVLLAYADIVKRDFEKYTHRQKDVS